MTMFSNVKYETLKLFLDQIAMAVFGIVTAVATSRSDVLTLICGIIGVGLYFYIIYATMWEIGAKDKIKVDAQREQKQPQKPLLMGLTANIPNFVLALAGLLVLAENGAAQSVGNVAITVSKLIQGCYLGIAKLAGLGGNPYTYFVTALAGVGITVIGYTVGFSGRKFLIFEKKKNG